MTYDKKFLLGTDQAKTLYARFASDLPIIDCSTRISLRDIIEDRRISNLWEILQSDEKLLLAMRACGTKEKYVTGNSSDYEKFRAFCECMPSLFGNPIYILSHMALKTFFGCGYEICPENCDAIWRYTADIMQKECYTLRSLLSKFNIELLCASVNLTDQLPDATLSSTSFRLLPAVCADRLAETRGKEYSGYINELSQAFGGDIHDIFSLEEALTVLLDRWGNLGCRTVRYSLPSDFRFERPEIYHANRALISLLDKGKITDNSLADILTSQILRVICSQVLKRGWTLQISLLGTDTAETDALLSYLKESDLLPQIILSPSSPSDNYAIYSLCSKYSVGNGNMPSVAVGFGCGANASFGALEKQFTICAEILAIGKIIGGAYETSSVLSFLMHDLFKRTLCLLIAEWMEKGIIPNDMRRAGKTIEDIFNNNAKEFFRL